MSERDYLCSEKHQPKKKWSFERKFLVALLSFAFGLPLLFFIFLVLDEFSMKSEQNVVYNRTLTSEWSEFTPPKPLKPTKQVQVLVLVVAEPLTKSNLDLEHVKLNDGTVVQPEIQLVDQFGNIFVADVSQSATPSPYNNSVFGYVSGLPQDRTYTKVRVKSDRELKVSRIVWYCWDGK
jgi:hypothetical protein